VSSGSIHGLGFLVAWQPDGSQVANRTTAYARGSYGVAGLDTTYHTGSGNATLTEAVGLYGGIYLIKGGSHSGSAIITKAYGFYAPDAQNATGGIITDNYAYYDVGQTTGVNNWGLGINTQSYINANLSIGKNTAPTVTLDVAGDAKISSTLEVGTPQTYTPSNVNTDRSYDADSTTLDEVADVLGTLIADLQTIGLIN
jgi:hypothetical protein